MMAAAGTATASPTSARKLRCRREARALQNAVAARDDAPDRFAGLGINGESGVIHALLHFKMTTRFRQSFVNINRHIE